MIVKMRADGYKAIMIKEAVGNKFRAKAKGTGKTLTAYLEWLLQRCNKDTAVHDTCNKEVRRILEEVQEEVKTVREMLEEVRR